ncbi:hypothetical protein HJG60_001835 [Phyllostomus discolor]|uniref:CFA20 domain-containing protein n=1 Tax=Phyllostomus discolor TaxID=89673 RepID=A0A833ZRR4_9CHIR|nr:hypothetical protein HJG60_001835 [Phyllostomus discolor]
MFKNEYQGGAFVEIFSAQGKNPGAKWKILGSPSVIWKEFDKEVKSFVFVLEGSSQTNKIQLPKENKQILGLIQRFLVLQIYIPLGQDFSTELLEQEILRGHPSLQSAAELNLLTHCFQSVMQDSDMNTMHGGTAAFWRG